MSRFLWSRSPSVVLIRLADQQQLWQRYRTKARRHWKEVFASFVLIASFMMVIFFMSAWNKRMTEGPKQFKGSRQKGPFGRPETEPPEKTEQTTDPNRPMGRAALEKTAAAKHKAQTAAPRMTSPTEAGTTSERPATTAGQADLQEGDDEAFEAPRGKVSGKNVRAYCNNSVCRHLKKWFIETVGRQADPCKQRNTFVCDSSVTFPSFPADDAEHSAVVHGSRESAHSNYYSYGPIGADGDDLMQSCVEYSKRPEAGVPDVLSFLSHFNLDIRHMADDPTEDPLKRMMELSLDYGVDAPVAFTRQYDVTGDALTPFVIDIALNPEMNEFIAASRTMGEEDIQAFYRSFLKQYALVENNTIEEQLMDSDDEISEFVNDTYGSAEPVKMSITSLSSSTGVTPDQWKELLSLFGRSKSASYEHVTTDEQALAMVAYLSHAGDRLGKRIVLAWHVLRYLVGPKVDLLATISSTSAHGDLDDVVMLTREDKCQRLVEKVSGVPYKALDMLEGKDIVPVETISDVTRLMGEFQDAASFVFKGGVKLSDAVTNDRATVKASMTAASRRVALFPESARAGSDAKYLFRAFGDTKATDSRTCDLQDIAGTMKQGYAVAAHNFPQLWLRRLRAWHALPPLMQALLPIMAAIVNVESPATFFRSPYYDVRAPPTYNFAALGQIIAQAMAREFIERRRVDTAESERLRRFWDKGDHATDGSVYCLFPHYNKNGTTRRRIRLNESDLRNGVHLGELLGSRIAHLAFRRARHSKASDRGLMAWTLPGVLLTSKQLFFVMHCALSCAMGGNHDSPYSPPDQGCMVMYKTKKRFIDAPCGKASTKRVPHECHHL